MLTKINNPIIAHKLTLLRDKDTNRAKFNRVMEDISILSLPVIFEDLNLKKRTVETPVSKGEFDVLADRITVISILRAGLGMQRIMDFIPGSKAILLGMTRDEESLKPQWYYRKNLEFVKDRVVLVLDPMLATGGTMSEALKLIKTHSPKRIKVHNIVASQQGMKNITENFPNVELFINTVDEELTQEGFIKPGLGDAGDRLFGTLRE